MQYSKLLMLNTVFAICCCLSPAIYAENVCDAFVKYGVYDTRESTNDIEKAKSFHSWFCQSKFSNKESADAAGVSLGYGGFTLGLNSSNEKWEQFYGNYCKDESSDSRYKLATRTFVQTINQNASNNMLSCFNRGGLHVQIVPAAAEEKFYFLARMNSTTEPPVPAKIKSFHIDGATCVDQYVKGDEISGAGVENLCTRSGKEAVNILITATEQVNWDTPRGLSKIEPIATVETKTITSDIIPPLPALPPPINIRAQDFSSGTNVGIDTCTEGPGILGNAKPCKPRFNSATFTFNVLTPGDYNLEVNYAAKDSRPVQLSTNAVVIRSAALSDTTGGWDNAHLAWKSVGMVTLQQGTNTIRLDRGGVFPHIHDLRLVPK